MPADPILAATRELARLIEQFAGEDGVLATAIPRLFLIRSSRPTDEIHAVHEPAVCLVAQGRKQVMVGQSVYVYDPAKYLVVSVDVPLVGQILEASADAPYLCLRLDLDPAAIGALMLEAKVTGVDSEQPGPALSLSSVTFELLDSAIRLVRLLAVPRDIPILAPLAEREILYRLLQGDQTSKLRQIAFAESKLQQINRAIGWIKRNFREPFSIDALASEARMSPSTLHGAFQGRDLDEPAAVPEAAAAAGGAPSHPVAVDRCCNGGPFGRLREPVSVQPRVQADLRRAARPRRLRGCARRRPGCKRFEPRRSRN